MTFLINKRQQSGNLTSFQFDLTSFSIFHAMLHAQELLYDALVVQLEQLAVFVLDETLQVHEQHHWQHLELMARADELRAEGEGHHGSVLVCNIRRRKPVVLRTDSRPLQHSLTRSWLGNVMGCSAVPRRFPAFLGDKATNK